MDPGYVGRLVGDYEQIRLGRLDELGEICPKVKRFYWYLSRLDTLLLLLNTNRYSAPSPVQRTASARKAATTAVERSLELIHTAASVEGETVARSQRQIDAIIRMAQQDAQRLEDLGEGWASAYGAFAVEMMALGDIKAWINAVELQLRSVKAELEHAQACLQDGGGDFPAGVR
ncbi:unnamed protein product [Choristocarpus tenellus]